MKWVHTPIGLGVSPLISSLTDVTYPQLMAIIASPFASQRISSILCSYGRLQKSVGVDLQRGHSKRGESKGEKDVKSNRDLNEIALLFPSLL